MNKLPLERNVSSQEKCDFNLQNFSYNQKIKRVDLKKKKKTWLWIFYRVLMFPSKTGMATKGVGYFCQISLF